MKLFWIHGYLYKSVDIYTKWEMDWQKNGWETIVLQWEKSKNFETEFISIKNQISKYINNRMTESIYIAGHGEGCLYTIQLTKWLTETYSLPKITIMLFQPKFLLNMYDGMLKQSYINENPYIKMYDVTNLVNDKEAQQQLESKYDNLSLVWMNSFSQVIAGNDMKILQYLMELKNNNVSTDIIFSDNQPIPMWVTLTAPDHYLSYKPIVWKKCLYCPFCDGQATEAYQQWSDYVYKKSQIIKF